MKTKVLALFLLASSSMFAGWRVGFGVGVGPVYVPSARVYVAPSRYGYVAPPTYYVTDPYGNEYVSPAPYVRSYWASDHDGDRWRDGDRRHDGDRWRDGDRRHDGDRWRDGDHGRDGHHDRDGDRWRRDR